MPVSAVSPWVGYAQACGVQLWGLCENQGYFLGGVVDATGSGLLTAWGGLLASNNVDTFIAQIGTYLQGAACAAPLGGDQGHQRNAASFIVLTMLGYDGGTATADMACSLYHTTWVPRVREYAANGLINFNENFSYVYNTRLQRSTLDIAWYGASDTRASIVFRAPNGTVLYAIKKDCANPVSGVSGPGVLTPVNQPLTIVCGGATPLTVEVGEDFTLRVSFTTAGGTGPPAIYTIRVYDFQEAGIANGTIAAVFGQVPRSGGSGSGTLPNPIPGSTTPPRINTPGLHSGRFVVDVTDATNSPRSCPFTISAVQRPYHKVFGGDVLAGAAFGTPCVDPNSRLIGWNNSNFLAFGLSVGSGTQLASMALNEITEFGSGQVRNALNPVANTPKNLAFANTTLATHGGSLGGGNTPCAPEYWNPPGAVLTGNQTIAGRDLAGGAAGNRQTIYVQGNAYITGNIRFTNTDYASINEIPSFRLIVRGNIYIAPGVSELNGLFVAIPTTASNGKVFTCSNSFGPPTLAQLNSVCRNPLTVYGSVVADMIKFTRTNGTLSNARPTDRMQSGAVPAERFIYTPEAWLTSDFGPGDTYDSFAGLPPVL